MSLVIISEPPKTDLGTTSNVQACRTQALYAFFRNDFGALITAIATVSTRTQFTITGGGVSVSDFIIGGTIFYEDPRLTPTGGVFSVTDVIAGVDVIVEISVDLGLSTITAGLVLNELSVRASYRVEMLLFDSAGTTQIIEEVFEYIPKQDGNLTLDYATVLFFGLTGFGNNEPFTPKFREVFGSTIGTLISLQVIQASKAELQLLSQFGANLLRYLLNGQEIFSTDLGAQDNSGDVQFILAGNVTADFIVGEQAELLNTPPYPNGFFVILAVLFSSPNTLITLDTPFLGAITSSGGTLQSIFKAKLLTWYEEGIKWIGWKRTVSFVVDKDVIARTGTTSNQVVAAQRNIDINNNFISTLINEAVNVAIPNFITITLLDPTDPNSVINLFFVLNNQQTINIAENINFVFRQECLNPIMLEWLNEFGVIEQHLFQFEQEFTAVPDEGLQVEIPITQDIEDLRTTKRRFVQAQRQRALLVSENLTDNQIRTLLFLKKSDGVSVYLTRDGNETVSVVVVDPLDTPFSSDLTGHTFRIMIEFPDDFDFFKAKKY